MNANLHASDYAALSPLLILLVSGLLILLLETFLPQLAKKIVYLISLAALLVALIAAYFAPSSSSALLNPWLNFDSFARLFTFFFLGIGIASVLLAYAFFQRFHASEGEYYFLLLSALFGLILIGSSADFLTFFRVGNSFCRFIYSLYLHEKVGALAPSGPQIFFNGIDCCCLSPLWYRSDLWCDWNDKFNGITRALSILIFQLCSRSIFGRNQFGHFGIGL